MERFEEFIREGKQFVYIDLSHFNNNDEFSAFYESMKGVISQYPEKSVYTITNIAHVKFDTTTKDLTAKWMEHNKPYVIRGAVFGLDGIKKIMVNAIFKMSGRSNMHFSSSKEDAIAWLLEQEY